MMRYVKGYMGRLVFQFERYESTLGEIEDLKDLGQESPQAESLRNMIMELDTEKPNIAKFAEMDFFGRAVKIQKRAEKLLEEKAK